MQRMNPRRDHSGSSEWQLAEAKNKFSEVYRRAVTEGRQRITKRGEDPVYVISESELESIEGKKPNFIEYLMNSPKIDDLELPSRDWDQRDVEL
jgi:prevent-host-death family protein